jgi:hypothetical protein
MTRTEAVVASIVAFAVAATILGISSLIYFNSVEGKSKDKQQFSECVQSGGSYVRNERGPICIK